jgi:hypothetical protein
MLCGPSSGAGKEPLRYGLELELPVSYYRLTFHRDAVALSPVAVAYKIDAS